MTWIPLYYYDKGGFDISSTLIVTVMLPIGYALAPPIAGFISDKFLLSNRKPLTFISCVVSALVLFSICIVDPSQTKIGASLMLIGGISLGMSQLPVMAVDFFGKEMAATTSALVDAHGYLYAGIQAVVVSLIVGLSDNWIMVFVLMGMIRVMSAVILLFVRPGLRS
jgi:sugar phosphate permease